MNTSSLSKLKKTLRPRSRLQELVFALRHSHFGLIPAQNLLLDLRDGYLCGGITPTRFREVGANPIQHTDYRSLDEIFLQNGINITKEDVLVDIGCGKGRVVSFWLRRRFGRKLIGIELDPDAAAVSTKRFRGKDSVTIINGDAVDHLPTDGTIFYLWNPFNEQVMRRFSEKLISKADQMPNVQVIYNNCRHAEVFTSNPAWETRPITNKDAYPAILAELKRNLSEP
jgi:SAM-dependent methyltransferase